MVFHWSYSPLHDKSLFWTPLCLVLVTSYYQKYHVEGSGRLLKGQWEVTSASACPSFFPLASYLESGRRFGL